MNLQKLAASLPMIDTFDWKDRELIEVKVKPDYAIVNNELIVSGEDDQRLVDYYGEFRDGYPYICPELEEWAEKHNGYWEWQDPGAIVFCPD